MNFNLGCVDFTTFFFLSSTCFVQRIVTSVLEYLLCVCFGLMLVKKMNSEFVAVYSESLCSVKPCLSRVSRIWVSSLSDGTSQNDVVGREHGRWAVGALSLKAGGYGGMWEAVSLWERTKELLTIWCCSGVPTGVGNQSSVAFSALSAVRGLDRWCRVKGRTWWCWITQIEFLIRVWSPCYILV